MKRSLIAEAAAQISAQAIIADSMHAITIWRGVEQDMRLPYPPEVERRAQRAAWGRSKKFGKRK